MDRVLLGKSEEGKVGLWVSKPGINVIAYAGNTYFDDMYGLNQNFKWSGEASFNHNFVGILSSEHPQTEPTSTANGTLLLSSHGYIAGNKGNPNFIYVMNTSPNWTSGFYAKGYRSHLKDTSFHGATYPLLEFRIRRPQLAPGVYWSAGLGSLYSTLQNRMLRWYFATSNTTHPSGSIVPGGGDQWGEIPSNNLDSIFGEQDDWVTIEYDFENLTYRWERDDGQTGSAALSTSAAYNWVADTYIHALMFNPLGTGDVNTPTLAVDNLPPDFELEYVRSKKRGVPMNFGVSIQDQFSFSSDWEETGLVHQTGTVTIGNEYAWANGTSKESGTSHPGSTSGHVTFPKLPYIPVVLFQRMDSDNPNISFPGGDKEFSFAHCDMNSNIQVWNPLTKQYQTSTNTSYGSEYRTFAYARAGYDGFDLTCRNAIARDGFEWLFNYTPQEPYIEIYKGGNYDPETENPETFVMYPQTRQQGGSPIEFSSGDGVPAVDNGLFSNSIFDAYRSPLLNDFYGYKANQGKTEINNIIEDLPTSVHQAPLVKRFGDELSVLLTNQDTTKQTFGDEGVNGRNHAVGYMRTGVLGVRRGKIFKQSDLPDDMQYHDANNIVNEAVGFTGAAGYHNDISTVVVNNAAYIHSGTIRSSPFRWGDNSTYSHDWSARDHMDGKLGYFAKYTGMDKGNCLPTFDWANKFGDWNVPQFNNFYQYIPEIGVGSYTSFKDAIGTSWTEENTKFLDDSMWLGYANNRFEYKGDIWHPQAPTKTYDELSGMFGYGGTIAHQGDWHDFAGSNTAYLWNFNNMIDSYNAGGIVYDFNGSEPYPRRDSYKSFPGHGYLGIHAVSRFDSNTSFNTTYRNAENGPFAADVQFRNRYMYRPFNGVSGSRANATRYGGLGFSGPGTQVTYGRLHDYGRTQINSYTESALGLNSGIDYYSNIRKQTGDLTTYNYPKRWNLESVLPSPKYWTDSSDDNQSPRDTAGLLPSLEEQQSGYNAHKDSFVVSRWYTYPGATFSYDISNFSGPAHYDAWYKNDVTKETNDYKRKDYPQLYTGGWGNYGYFPTQEQLDQGKGATRLFPIRKDQYGVNLTDYSFRRVGNPNPHGYGSFPPDDDPYYVNGGTQGSGFVYTPAQFAPDDNLGFAGSDIQGPFTIFKKRDMLYGSILPVRSKTIPYDNDTVYLYFKPNHLHEEKQISKTFGIPNEIAGDYYVASTVHNERGANPQVAGSTGVVDAFHDLQGTLGTYDGLGWHTKHYDQNQTLVVPSHIGVYGEDSWRHGMPYYHPVYNAGFFAEEMNRTTYPDYKLNNYLLSKGIDVNTLDPGDPIPIKADPYFAGMAFEGCNKITGAFTAHRFEFIIKKTKTHINHFRQSYEYNLPGRSGHRADTLRPIGYGLVSGVTGFDSYHGPPPAAHSYFDGRQLSGGHPYWRDAGNVLVDGVDEVNFYITTQLYEDSPQNNKNGLRAAFGTLYRSHDDGSISDATHPAYNTTAFPNGGWGNALQEVKYDIDFYIDDADSETIKSAQLGGKYAFTGFGNAGFPAQFSQMNSLTSFVPGDVETRIFTYGGYNPNAGISGGFLIPFFYASPRGPDELGGFGYQEDPTVYSPLSTSIIPITDYNYDTTAHEMQQGARLSVSISRHGRDQMYRDIIGAVEVANTYFADHKATLADGVTKWINEAPSKNYYNLGRPLSYRPAKSQGASPETQMYGAYLGAPFNRYSDYHKAWAGLNSNWLSNGNHWEDDILPGMCKADNALTNWGTVDLSKFDHNHIGYKWHNDAWHDADSAGLAESIIWSPNKVNVRFNEAGKGGGADPASGVTKRTPNQKGGCYDGFKLHERPEFQPVSGDGRYFGGVGGVDNWGGTSYNTWGPGMSVSPTVWDLKWTSIQHPFGVAPTEAQNANQFYGATSVWNQTSYIGGAPNYRFTIGDNGEQFKYSDGTSPTTFTSEGTTVSAGQYIDPITFPTVFKGSTPQNYEWAIGGSQIQCNYWDRTLKVDRLTDTTLDSGPIDDVAVTREVVHANNGIQPLCSFKIKSVYNQYAPFLYVFAYDNGIVDASSQLSDWRGTDEIQIIGNGKTFDTRLLNSTELGQLQTFSGKLTTPLPIDYGKGLYGPIGFNVIKPVGFSNTLDGDFPLTSNDEKNYTIYNKTLAEDPTRHPAGSFRANTTYHFQYAYNATVIKPPEYRYWVLRIPASMDAYNGESLI